MWVNALNVVQTVAPTVEPVTTAEAKTHLRIDTSAEDAYIGNLIESARRYVENYTGRALVERTYRADLYDWDTIVHLPFPPTISVSSVKYYDTSNAQQTWAASNYEVDAAGSRILLASTGTIPAYYYRYNCWQVTWVAGYESTTSPEDYRAPIPEDIKSAILLVIGDLYENRERSTPLNIRQLPTVANLLGGYRTRL